MGRLKKKQSSDPKKKWPPTFKIGRFTALNISLYEAAINTVVLRVHLKSEKGRHKSSAKVAKSKPLKRLNDSSTNRIKRSKSPKPVVLKSNVKNGHRRVQKSNKKVVKQFDKNIVQCYPHSRLTVDFQKLAELVCVMKLPSSKWKVTVLMNHDLTTVYQFTNSFPQKSVTFSENNPACNIKMLGIPVILLGCPKTVDSLRDIEVLLEIVNRLDLRDCMVAKI